MKPSEGKGSPEGRRSIWRAHKGDTVSYQYRKRLGRRDCQLKRNCMKDILFK